MDLQRLFPVNPVCLLEQTPESRTWRILRITDAILNYLRVWLLRELLSVAINWVEVYRNTSNMYDEFMAHRLGLIPLVADPLKLKDFEGTQPELCSADTCLIFELNVWNNTSQVKDILSRDLKWIPVGDQAQRFTIPPHPLHDDLLILRLAPGQEVKLRAFAIRGTGSQHAKWSQVDSFFRTPQVPLIPTRTSGLPPVNTPIGAPQSQRSELTQCVPCDKIPLDIQIQPGFNCYYFTINLTGGLSFEDIDRQLSLRFNWGGRYPPQPVKYIFEQS